MILHHDLQFMFLNWCSTLGISATYNGIFLFGDVSAKMFHSQNVDDMAQLESVTSVECVGEFDESAPLFQLTVQYVSFVK
jgi:hypothetical protein